MKLAVGIGCKRGTRVEQIDAAVLSALGPHSIDEIHAVATIDSKAHEPGIVEFCARHSIPLRVFSREQIAAVFSTTEPATAPSAIVREQLGVDGVCEPCALLAAPAGRLITPKRAFNGVTIALAIAAGSVADTTFEHKQTAPLKQDDHP